MMRVLLLCALALVLWATDARVLHKRDSGEDLHKRDQADHTVDALLDELLDELLVETRGSSGGNGDYGEMEKRITEENKKRQQEEEDDDESEYPENVEEDTQTDEVVETGSEKQDKEEGDGYVMVDEDEDGYDDYGRDEHPENLKRGLADTLDTLLEELVDELLVEKRSKQKLMTDYFPKVEKDKKKDEEPTKKKEAIEKWIRNADHRRYYDAIEFKLKTGEWSDEACKAAKNYVASRGYLGRPKHSDGSEVEDVPDYEGVVKCGKDSVWVIYREDYPGMKITLLDEMCSPPKTTDPEYTPTDRDDEVCDYGGGFGGLFNK